ncbi:hypothetical protein LSTR_LSTR016980 [Laodelphax striatellus]|uniref:Uncharacterized protein n=1 Tax=Laodelphax striatellus TaxID=195883 RepID=A0A482WYM8_LAOST|nr:hypothetical protein LSTR_LSTR016980 [Laodelphax striatellus]
MGASLQQQHQLVSANGNAASSPPPLPLDSVVMATTCLVEPKRTASFRLQPHHNSSTVVTVLATTGGGHR